MFFCIELCMFTWVYYYGPHGMQVLHKLVNENTVLEKEVAMTRTDIKELETKIIAWNSDPFYKEQVAREQLQMARKNEIIYYI